MVDDQKSPPIPAARTELFGRAIQPLRTKYMGGGIEMGLIGWVVEGEAEVVTTVIR